MIVFSITCQVYSLINIKGFWLDEWFILYNIKFRNYSGLFDNLYYIQQFPRVYLSLLKLLIEIFNYNYFAIRVIPFSIQVINIGLVYFLISKIVFPGNKVKALLIVLFFLSFHTTLFYFSQLKQYTMDIFFALMSAWYFYYLSQYYQKISARSFGYIAMLFFIFIGSFFSYTFPIVITPVMLGLFITSLRELYNKKLTIKPVLPVVIFIFSLVLNYYTDLQFVLSDKGQYHNFDIFIMNYNGIYLIIKSFFNIAWLFTSIFFFDKYYNSYFLYLLYFIKVVVLIFSLLGFIIILYKEVIKLKTERPWFFQSLSFTKAPGMQVYFLLLFFLTLFLYLLRLLPVGTFRLNYFCCIYISYFLITGIFYIIKRFNNLKYVLLPVVIFAAAFPALASDICELKNTNLNFDQKVYDNVGKAIKTAKINTSPIFVSYNEFYPMSIMQGQENLIIKSHHAYKPKDSIPVFVFKKGELNNLLDSLHPGEYILLTKYNYQTLCNK